MTQSLEQAQHQLSGVLQTIAILHDKVEVLEASVANTAGTETAATGTPTDPLVRWDFMNFSIDSDRSRLDALEEEKVGMKDTMDALADALEANTKWQTTELRAVRDRIQDPKSAQGYGSSNGFGPGNERRSELKFLTRQKGFHNLKSYNGGTSTQWEEWRFGIMTWIQQEYPKISILGNKLE